MSSFSFTLTATAIQTLPVHLSVHAPRLPCCKVSSGTLVVTPPSLDRRAGCKAQVCSSGTFISSISGVKVTLAFNLVKKSCPSNATGHSGTYKKKKKKRLCFRLGASTWQPRDCKNSFWRGFLDTPLARCVFFRLTFWVQLLANPVFKTEQVAPVPVRKTIYFPQKGYTGLLVGDYFPKQSPLRESSVTLSSPAWTMLSPPLPVSFVSWGRLSFRCLLVLQ